MGNKKSKLNGFHQNVKICYDTYYTGEFKDGKRHGKGTFIYGYVEITCDSINTGKCLGKTGTCKMITGAGTVKGIGTIGHSKHGRFLALVGEGSIKYPTGNVFKGEIHNTYPDGSGKLFMKNKTYVGKWVLNDKYHGSHKSGNGKYIYNNGVIVNGVNIINHPHYQGITTTRFIFKTITFPDGSVIKNTEKNDDTKKKTIIAKLKRPGFPEEKVTVNKKNFVVTRGSIGPKYRARKVPSKLKCVNDVNYFATNGIIFELFMKITEPDMKKWTRGDVYAWIYTNLTDKNEIYGMIKLITENINGKRFMEMEKANASAVNIDGVVFKNVLRMRDEYNKVGQPPAFDDQEPPPAFDNSESKK
jgi:hypothetical protein